MSNIDTVPGLTVPAEFAHIQPNRVLHAAILRYPCVNVPNIAKALAMLGSAMLAGEPFRFVGVAPTCAGKSSAGDVFRAWAKDHGFDPVNYASLRAFEKHGHGAAVYLDHDNHRGRATPRGIWPVAPHQFILWYKMPEAADLAGAPHAVAVDEYPVEIDRYRSWMGSEGQLVRAVAADLGEVYPAGRG